MITINGVSVPYKWGYPIKEKYNEELDTGLIRIVKTADLDIQPNDRVILGDINKNMLVADTDRITSSFTNEIYNYDVWLISPTFQLQGILLPNRSVTQPADSTVARTDIYTVLSNYVSQYTDFTISTALQTLTTGVDCPEFQWNRPTLYEVLNDLLSEVDAVVTMTEFDEIDYLGFSETGSEIDATKLGDEKLRYNAQDYADTIENELENAIIGQENTHTIQWLALKTEDESIVTTENTQLILEKPVYKINSMQLKVLLNTGSISVPNFELFEYDITDNVVEKSVYQQLLPSNTTGYISGDVKRNHIYFTEGSNIIDGFSYNEDNKLGISTYKAIVNILANEIYDDTGLSPSLDNDDILRYVFKVDYQALETVKTISHKNRAIRNSRAIINNQDTSYVDYQAFNRKQQQTINRLGNQTLVQTAKYNNDSTLAENLVDVPSLGDKRGDFVLAERERVIYEKYVNYKGILSKNYVMKDLFTGVKQARRYNKIATEKEAFESHHILEKDFMFTKTSTASVNLTKQLVRFGIADERVTAVSFETDVMATAGTSAAVAPSIYTTEKSINIVFKMYDNFNVGVSADTTTTFFSTKVGVNNMPYVDDNGNFETYSYVLYQNLANTNIDLTSPTNTQWLDGVEEARLYPSVDTSNLSGIVDLEGSITRNKDNREITVETIQYNFKNNYDEGIFISDVFTRDNSLGFIENVSNEYRVAASFSETYDETDKVYKGTLYPLSSLTFSRADNEISISAPGTLPIENLMSWAIVDLSGNIAVAVNGTGNDKVYLKEV